MNNLFVGSALYFEIKAMQGLMHQLHTPETYLSMLAFMIFLWMSFIDYPVRRKREVGSNKGVLTVKEKTLKRKASPTLGELLEKNFLELSEKVK